jgi:Kef-type K+ transport system membrane component KefB
MSLTSSETAHLLFATVLLLGAAHLMGQLFVRVRYPRVIGEIVGGLMLGPTLFGAVLPEAERRIFPATGVTPIVLGALYQLGLIFLMFATGGELGLFFRRGERRTAATITVSGMLLPFLAGILIFELLHPSDLEGSAHNARALSLVFAASIAVTGIPVISRIMMDLGILNTPFARIVLNAAVIEDVVLYAILAVAVGLAESATGGFGVASLLGVDSASPAGAAYYVIATLLVLALALAIRPWLALILGNLNLLGAMAPQLIVILTITATCLLLSITPVYGGFVAGVLVGSIQDDSSIMARRSINRFAFAFFIPLYFAIVGLHLNLLHSFNVALFAGFLTFACAVKTLSVYAGARLAGEATRAARNFAITMNARGAQGIVLASVAFDAHIIDARFYAYLVVFSIVTSLIAGLWLERVVRGGTPLREQDKLIHAGPSQTSAPLSERQPAPQQPQLL